MEIYLIERDTRNGAKARELQELNEDILKRETLSWEQRHLDEEIFKACGVEPLNIPGHIYKAHFERLESDSILKWSRQRHAAIKSEMELDEAVLIREVRVKEAKELMQLNDSFKGLPERLTKALAEVEAKMSVKLPPH